MTEYYISIMGALMNDIFSSSITNLFVLLFLFSSGYSVLTMLKKVV